MLVMFGGLPGSGKTTLAKELARQLTTLGKSAVYLRIDTIEQAILRSKVAADAGTAGYFVAYALASDNLQNGSIVVVDAVNPLPSIRESWMEVATQADALFIPVEVICSDAVEHRRRVEARKCDIEGHVLPTWSDVTQGPYQPWACPHTIVDTATMSVEEATGQILSLLPHIILSKSLEPPSPSTPPPIRSVPGS